MLSRDVNILPRFNRALIVALIATLSLVSVGSFAGDPGDKGISYWSPRDGSNVTYRVVYNKALAGREPGVYRRIRSTNDQSVIDDEQVIQGGMRVLPLDGSVDVNDLNSQDPMILARSDYAVVSTADKMLYILNSKISLQLSSVKADKIMARFNISSTNRRIYDTILVIDKNNHAELLVVRDDGVFSSAGKGRIDEQERLIINGKVLRTADDHQNLLTEAINKQPKPILTRSKDDQNRMLPVAFDNRDSQQTPNFGTHSRTEGTPHSTSNSSGRNDLADAPETSDEDASAFGKGITDAEVANIDGKKTSALDIVKVFAKDLGAGMANSTGEAYVSDLDIEKKIGRGVVKPDKGSVALVGEPGVDTLTTVEALVHDVFVSKKPELQGLRDYHFLQISTSALGAGSSLVGTTETKVNAMVELSKKNKIVWVIPQMHVLRGMGSSSKDPNDILDHMMGALSDGSMRVIGLSNIESFWSMFGGDAGLRQIFTLVTKMPPTDEQILPILRAWIKRHNLPEASEAVLLEVHRIATEMDSSLAQPGADTSLLSEIYADSLLSGDKSPETTISIADVHTAATSHYGMDPSVLDPTLQPARLDRLRKVLAETIIGQNLAKTTVTDITETILSNVHNNKKPRVMALLTGKKGLGKTEFMKSYAKALGLPLVIIEMNSFNSQAGFDRLGLMEAVANAINKCGFVVLGFDEMEKAPIAVQNELLKMLNDGVFTVTVREKGDSGAKITRTIDARKATVFMTANAGQDFLKQSNRQSIGFISTTQPENNTAFARNFKQALISDNMSEMMIDRMDYVVPFIDTARDEFKDVLALHLGLAIKDIEERKKARIHVENEAAFYEAAATQLFSPNISNRDAIRAVDQSVRQILARAFIGQIGLTDLTLRFDGTKFVAEKVVRGDCDALLSGHQATHDQLLDKKQ